VFVIEFAVCGVFRREGVAGRGVKPGIEAVGSIKKAAGLADKALRDRRRGVAYRDLREFIARLEKDGELRRVRVEVDPVLEVTEVVQRLGREARRGTIPHALEPHSMARSNVGPKGPTRIEAGQTPAGLGPALLFENPKGSRVPLLINAFGSVRRMCLAFEVNGLGEVAERIQGFLKMETPQGLFDKIKMLPKLAELGSFFPRSVKTGDCQEVVRKGKDVNLFDFPILKCWPQDGGRFITFPLVFTKNPETGKRNVGMYRMQIYDQRTTGMHWQTQKHGAEHFRRAREKNPEGRIPVSVAIGTDPATALSGMLPIPPDLDEMMFAGFLRREPVEMVSCQTNELEVPANAEIVLEGYVNLNEMQTEGPFGDHTGFYSLEGDYPLFHVECMTQRKDPIYLTTVVGPPPQEDFHMGHAVERIFLPVMKMQYPEIVDVSMPAEGIFHNLMIVAIRKSYPGHARKVMNAIWSLGQAMFTKVIVVVDHDVDIHDYSEVVWKALCALDPERDVQFSLGPMDTLDHAARIQDFGSKMGIDATRKWASEGFTRPWPDEIRMDETTKKRVDKLWKNLSLD